MITRTSRSDRLADGPEQWLVITSDVQEVNVVLASSPLVASAFFAGWVCLGLLMAAAVPHPAEDRRTIRALGAGLGPLMAVVVMEAWDRRRAARPLVLAPGVDHGGTLDVLVWIWGQPADVRGLAPTLDTVVSDVGTLTLARALPHVWLEADEVVDEAWRLLVTARDLVPIRGAALVIAGDAAPQAAVRRCASEGTRLLVLHAIGDAASISDRW